MSWFIACVAINYFIFIWFSFSSHCTTIFILLFYFISFYFVLLLRLIRFILLKCVEHILTHSCQRIQFNTSSSRSSYTDIIWCLVEFYILINRKKGIINWTSKTHKNLWVPVQNGMDLKLLLMRMFLEQQQLLLTTHVAMQHFRLSRGHSAYRFGWSGRKKKSNKVQRNKL